MLVVSTYHHNISPDNHVRSTLYSLYFYEVFKLFLSDPVQLTTPYVWLCKYEEANFVRLLIQLYLVYYNSVAGIVAFGSRFVSRRKNDSDDRNKLLVQRFQRNDFSMS